MAFEKSKVLKAAEKFLAQGKLSPAIKEYRQIIDHDPDDLTTLNMLGDLLARDGRKDEAVSCFLRIAEHYREEQFRLKAIAMYKKVDKLKPGDLETAKSLADLYDAQGLIGDARAQYLTIADAYTRAGKTKQTLEILHKIADLDPQNTDIRLKLADGYLKEEMLPEAGKAYADAAARLLEKGSLEQSLASYQKAMELRANDRQVLRGLVSVHARLGTADDAAELLEKAVADNPEDTELMQMLAQAHLDADDAAGAERATAMLMSQDATNYRRYIDVARAYMDAGQQTDAGRILALIAEQMLAGREENDLLELVNELLTHDPDHVGGLRLLARIRWWQRDMDKLRQDLERLAEAAEAAGLADDERYALTQLVRLAPEESKFASRLEELGGSLEDAAEVPPMAEDEPEAVPVFETFGELNPEVTEVNPVNEAAFVFNSVAEEEPYRADASSSFADLNEPETAIFAHIEEPNAPVADQSSQEFVFTSDDLGGSAATTEAAQPDGSDAVRVETMMQQELESVDFYLSQGYNDIAADTLNLLERQFGSHPEINSRKQKLGRHPSEEGSEFVETAQVVSPGEGVLTAEPEVFGEIDSGASQPAATKPASAGIDSGLAEIFEEFRIEAEGDHVSSHEDYETHYNMATAYKEMDLLDEAIREFQVAANLAKPTDGTARFFQCCNMLGHCFVQKGMPRAAVLWFKKALEAPGRTPDEYKALQYELGSAYEQMGDIPRAIAVLTEVYGVDVGYRDIGERLQDLQAKQAAQKKKKKGK